MKQFLIKFLLLIWVTAVVIFIAPVKLPAESSIWAPTHLARLIEEGLANNQDIKSLESRVKSLRQEISFAGSLNDPRVGIAFLNLPTDTFRFDQEPMTQKQIFIAQKIPWFGKLSLQSQQAAIKAIRQEAILKAKRLELSREIATAYYELGFIASAQKINDRLMNILTRLLRVSETKYASGQGIQQDVLQVQVETSKLLDEQITLGKKRRTQEDRINSLLNRERFIPVTPPKNLPYPDSVPRTEELQTLSLQVEIDQANVEIELARKDYWPDMDVKVAYGQREEDFNGRDLPDFVSTSVVMNIPLWKNTRQDKKLEATKLSHQAALQSYQNLVNRIPHKIDALVSDIRNIRKNYRLITDALIVQADQWVRSSLSAYEVGKVEFSTMINAQIRLLRFQLQSENYLFSLYKKRAELEEVLGGPILTRNPGDKGSHRQEENRS